MSSQGEAQSNKPQNQQDNQSEARPKKQKTSEQEHQEETDWRHTINWELIYKTIVSFVLILIPFFVNDIIKFRQFCDERGFKYLPVSFIYWAFVAAIVLTIYRNVVFSYILTKLVQIYIPEKYTGIDRQIRVKKVVKWITDIFYYSWCTAFGYWAFGQKEWFPLQFKSDYSTDMLILWPNKQENDEQYYIEFYLCFQFGQHIYALGELIIVRRKVENKFYEWLLHHVLAFTLILYSVFSNFYAPGVAILLIHDIGDVFLAFFKAYGMFRTDFIFYVNTFNMIISWFITRVVIFPKGILLPLIKYYKILYIDNTTHQVPTKGCYIYMLTLAIILSCMHIYWFLTMLTMLMKHVKDIVKSKSKIHFQNDFDFHKKRLEKQNKKAQ